MNWKGWLTKFRTNRFWKKELKGTGMSVEVVSLASEMEFGKEDLLDQISDEITGKHKVDKCSDEKLKEHMKFLEDCRNNLDVFLYEGKKVRDKYSLVFTLACVLEEIYNRMGLKGDQYKFKFLMSEFKKHLRH